jgi:hypothetical protein
MFRVEQKLPTTDVKKLRTLARKELGVSSECFVDYFICAGPDNKFFLLITDERLELYKDQREKRDKDCLPDYFSIQDYIYRKINKSIMDISLQRV